jgi:hypothetical protein
MVAAAERRQEAQQAPHALHLQAEHVEGSVVDPRALAHRHAAAVMPAVADRDLHRVNPHHRLVATDLGPKSPVRLDRPP